MSKTVSKVAFAIGVIALGLLPPITVMAADTPSAAGVWKQINENGDVNSLVTISEDANGLYSGRFTKLFGNPNPICTACPGDKKGKPMIGLTFMEGLRRSGLSYTGGSGFDPSSGTTYSVKMELSPDGNTLTVRGYIGISLLGKSQTWTRMQ